MKIIVLTKKDIITHPLVMTLITNWAITNTVEYYTIHTDFKIDNCKVIQITKKKYLDHNKWVRYLMTIKYYYRILYLMTQLTNTVIYFPFSNGPIIDKIIKYFKGNNLVIFHAFEYDKSNLRASLFGDIIIHPETTRMKLASFELPNKNHLYFPNVTDIIKELEQYPDIQKLNEFANGKIKLFYQGLINIERRCLREILEVLKELESTYCLIIMPGHFTNPIELKELKGIINRLGIEKSVLFVPSIKSPNHLSIIEHVDIGIGLYKPNNINQFFAAPNRIFEINHFKKPLILPDNVGLKLFEYEYSGEIFCCDPNSKNSIIDAIKRATTLKTGTKLLSEKIGNFSKYFENLNDLISEKKKNFDDK